MNFCAACGRPRNGTSRYCKGCGNLLSDPDHQNASTQDAPVHSARPDMMLSSPAESPGQAPAGHSDTVLSEAGPPSGGDTIPPSAIIPGGSAGGSTSRTDPGDDDPFASWFDPSRAYV